MNAIKICITIPKYEFDIIEHERKKKMIKRSQFIQNIFDSFFKNRHKQSLINKYIAGYKHKPEIISEIISLEKAQFETLNKEKF